MRLEAVIFDLDNTLVNRNHAFSMYTEQFIDEFILCNDAVHKNEIMAFIQLADCNGYRNRYELFEEIANNFVMKNPEVSVEILLEHWFSEFFRCTVLMEGALDVLQCLKNKDIKIGIITNGSVHSQNFKINQVNIGDYFDSIIISDEVNILKPDKRIFELALQSLNVSPQTSWYVGDHPNNDVQGALDAGLNAIWMAGFMEWDEKIEKPQYVISSLNEIKSILKI